MQCNFMLTNRSSGHPANIRKPVLLTYFDSGISHQDYRHSPIYQAKSTVQLRFLGASLLELLVVVVLVGVMATLTWPAWQHALSRQRLLDNRQALQQILQAARVAAIQRQQSVTVCLQSAVIVAPVNCGANLSLTEQSRSSILVFVDHNGDHRFQIHEPILQS
jgi:Tfp pilus assembly protein FimT